MTSKNWKAVERKVAKKFKGGVRIPLSGMSNMGQVGDVGKLEAYNVEVKSGRQVPKTVLGWLETIRALHEEGKLPMLVMKPFRKTDEIVVMAMSDFHELLQRLDVEQEWNDAVCKGLGYRKDDLPSAEEVVKRFTDLGDGA